MPPITNCRILIMASDGFEQSELLVPLKQLGKAGATVDVASPDGRPIRGWDRKDWGEAVAADLAIDQVRVEAYDALVLPGGQINPDTLRASAQAVDIVRRFVEAGKVVAAICHAPWLLIEAGVVAGRRIASYASIRTDVTNAGAHWIDEAVVVDDGIVTSRSPEDLQAFVLKIIEEVQEGGHLRRVA